MEKGTIEVTVYGEGFCDYDIQITNSNGFSLETLEDIDNYYKRNRVFEKFYPKKETDSFTELIVKPIWIKEQKGNYESPNIEAEGYWDYEVVSKCTT